MKLKDQINGKKRIWLLMSRDWPAANRRYIEDHLHVRGISVVKTTDPAVALTARPPDVDWILLINDSTQSDIAFALASTKFGVPFVSLKGMQKTFVEVLRRYGFGANKIRVIAPRTDAPRSSSEELVFVAAAQRDQAEIDQGFFLKKILDLRETMAKMGIVRVDVGLTSYRTERLVDEVL